MGQGSGLQEGSGVGTPAPAPCAHLCACVWREMEGGREKANEANVNNR